jgi:hypothetical protein
MSYPFQFHFPFPLRHNDDYRNLESSPPSAASFPSTAASSTPSTPIELAPPPSPPDFRTHNATNHLPNPPRIFPFPPFPTQQHDHPAPMAQPRMPNSRTLPLPRRPTGPRISRQPSSRPPPEMIDLTISSPLEQRGSSPSNHARKKRRIANDVIMLDDDSDDASDEDEEPEDLGPPPIPAVETNPDEKPKKLAATSCIICMDDEPVDLSVTPCGKSFCQRVRLLGDADIDGDQDICSAINACLELSRRRCQARTRCMGSVLCAEGRLLSKILSFLRSGKSPRERKLPISGIMPITFSFHRLQHHSAWVFFFCCVLLHELLGFRC